MHEQKTNKYYEPQQILEQRTKNKDTRNRMHEQKTNKIMNHNRTQEDTIENTISINTIHTRVHNREHNINKHNTHKSTQQKNIISTI